MKPQGHKGGLLILPQKLDLSPPTQVMQRTLFDPSNPTKPIIMKTAGMRMPQPQNQYPQFSSPPDMAMHMRMPHQYPAGGPQYMHGNFPQQQHAFNKGMMQPGPESMLPGKPSWYDHYSER